VSFDARTNGIALSATKKRAT